MRETQKKWRVSSDDTCRNGPKHGLLSQVMAAESRDLVDATSHTLETLTSFLEWQEWQKWQKREKMARVAETLSTSVVI